MARMRTKTAKDVDIRIRVSAADKRALEQAATRETLTLSAWLRMVALKSARAAP